MTLESLARSVDITWVLIGAALVFFMQAGFAMVETGLTRAKNAGNIIMKNLMDFSIGTPIYWFIGFGIMFGGTGALFGGIDLFCLKTDDFATMIFQTVFCATSATIVSGAMAERTKFSAYCIYSALISLFVYPISGHWVWGGGWLAQLGFHDFAGSTAVHMVGGVAALIGASILGPRIGKYDKDGKPQAILGHSMTLAALGVFILWFCWFGFNGASTLGMSDGLEASAARIFFTTNLAAACATVTVMLFTWVRYKKPDVSMTLNGSLAGLVAITAGCDTVTPVGAALIGLIAGVAVVLGIEFVDQKLKVDDPVGAVGVHGICGALGTILTGLFAYYDFGGGERLGLFYGGGFRFLGTQLLGVVSVIAWVTVCMVVIFQALKHTIGLRASAVEEIDGLDSHEHGLPSAYADFVFATNLGGVAEAPAAEKGTVDSDTAVPVQLVTGDSAAAVGGAAPIVASDGKLTKITIVARQNKFEALKDALNAIGVTGMTVTNVMGCGVQKGKPEYYRGVVMDMDLRPKLQVDVVVSKVSPAAVVEAAKKALYTGHIGDGKIFLYHVENVIKVRTGEEGYDALQGENW